MLRNEKYEQNDALGWFYLRVGGLLLFVTLSLLEHGFSLFAPLNVPAHSQHALQWLSHWPAVCFPLLHTHANLSWLINSPLRYFPTHYRRRIKMITPRLKIIRKKNLCAVPFQSALCKAWAEDGTLCVHQHCLHVSSPLTPVTTFYGWPWVCCWPF